MPDADWFYHVTRPAVAQLIQRSGMRSALTRIRLPVAHPAGAFVQNREAQQVAKYHERLRRYVAYMVARGAAYAQLPPARGVYIPYVFNPVGDRAQDIPELSDIEERYLDTYRRTCMPKGAFARQQHAAIHALPQTANSAATLFADRGHYLTRLAIQSVAMEYKVEEIVSASHIYFIMPRYAEDCFRDYKRHLGDIPVVVLRVRQADVINPVQDDSEYRAMMSAHSVEAQHIQILAQAPNVADDQHHFLNAVQRQLDANWIDLANWHGGAP